MADAKADPTPSDRGAVVVTGASTGIGAATVEILARQGFTTFAGVRNADDAARIGAVHERIRPVYLDVTDSEAIVAATDAVAASELPLIGLVNNAGIAIGGPLEYLSIDDLRRQFEVNVFGALAVSQAFLPLLRKHHGRIVFVGSISGRLSVPFIGPYSASKFALRALADALRLELTPAGIEVSLIEPASVRTPIWRKGRESKDRMLKRLGPKAREHYRLALEQMFTDIGHEERTGMPVERVSNTILRALTARRPRAHYIITDPGWAAGVFMLLPAAAHDRIIRPQAPKKTK